MAGANPSSFEAVVDTAIAHSGTQCAHMYPRKNTGSDEWGTLMQQIAPGEFLGKRVLMSLWCKTKKVSGWVAPWMRVDGEKRSDTVSFDNFCTRQIKGTTDWTQYQIVLDVPQKSTNVAFGVMLGGGDGQLWIDDVSFEIVGTDVPVTDCPCFSKEKPRRPVNLNFEETDDDDEDDINSGNGNNQSENENGDSAKEDNDNSATWKKLKSLSPKNEGKIKSVHAKKSTDIKLENKTNATVTVYWLDYEGERKRYGKIKPSESFSVQTFETHPWLLADKKDKGLAIFVAGSSAGIGILKDD